MRHSKVRAKLRWISAFVNVMLHSCSPAQAWDYACVYQSEPSHSEGRSQRLTMTLHVDAT
jgi:hypothetical protein